MDSFKDWKQKVLNKLEIDTIVDWLHNERAEDSAVSAPKQPQTINETLLHLCFGGMHSSIHFLGGCQMTHIVHPESLLSTEHWSLQ